MNSKEVWRDIIGYENLYQISNLGNVKSLSRDIKHYKGGYSTLKGKPVRLRKYPTGYLYVGLRNGAGQKLITIHRLIYEAFVGKIPEGLHIDHIDRNRSNNSIENLRIVNARENQNNRIGQSELGAGVSLRKSGEYRACIQIKHKQVHLGQFNSAKEASLKYESVYRQLIKLDKSNVDFDFIREYKNGEYFIKFILKHKL